MESKYKEDVHYRNAKKKVDEIKSFYIHLLVYLVINIGIIVFGNREEGLWEALKDPWTYFTALSWGIGLLAHWAGVFGPNIFFGKKWEERKVQELMKKDSKRGWE